MQTAKVKKKELPIEKERGDPSKGRRALEKYKNSCSPSKVAKQWRNIPFMDFHVKISEIRLLT